MFQQKVQEFHDAFKIKSPDHATLSPLSEKNKDLHALRVNLIQEELDELKEALSENDIVEAADALGDLLYVVYGAACCFGLDMEPIFNEIHRSNMSKLENGKPIYRHDGKVLKGQNYTPPNLEPIVKEQTNV